MSPLGSTRSTIRSNHALICPDSFVRSGLPGWKNAQVVILISPQMGARFTQYLAFLSPGGATAPALPGVQRVVYVVDGYVQVRQSGRLSTLGAGTYFYLPPGDETALQAKSQVQLCVFEKPYRPLGDGRAPRRLQGQASEVAGQPFMGDDAARLQVLLPDEPTFDLAVNVFTYQPGAALPMVEIHEMEHGLLMLSGAGVYRLGDSWYPVQAGDVIWMASYCPQWFVAMGKTPASYLYYKDVNRDPLAGRS